MVIGPTDAGKTTFTGGLATARHAQGLRVGIVDADVGQSEVGPPGTVGLGTVTAELLAFEFIGLTSPGRQPWRTAEATARLVARARAEFDRVVVDTSGFVAGGFGAALKRRKIEGAAPDAVVVIQRGDECEHIVREIARPRVVRLPALSGVAPRTQAARRRHRELALARHLEGARPVVLDAARVAVRSIAGAPVALETIAPATVVAVHDRDGAALALGVVEAADASAGTLTVRTAHAAHGIASVTVGEMTAG